MDETGEGRITGRARAPGRARASGRVRDRRCRRGHPMDYVSPGGKAVCRRCHARRARKWRRARTLKRLKDRRARIAGRRALPRDDRVWAAGLFEGEGTLSIMTTGTRPYTRPWVSVTSTDRAVVDFFHARWPGYVRGRTPRTATSLARKAYEWTLCSNDTVEGFLLDLRPFWRTARVRTKAALLLDEIRDRVRNPRSAAVKRRSATRLKTMRALNRRGLVRPRRVVGGGG